MPRSPPGLKRKIVSNLLSGRGIQPPDVASLLAALPLAMVRPPDDAVHRARSGDVRAFEQLYREHCGGVLSLCRRLCGGQEELASSLTQEVFVRAWQKLSSFRGDAAFSTWLHRLAVNLVLTDRRTKMRRVAREQAAAGPTEEPAPQRRVDAGMDLERAIAGLPTQARTVFVLHAIEGYKHEEIADMMKLSAGTSKAQLHRARALLRKALA